MEFQLSYSKSWRWQCKSAALNMPANLENSAVATGLEKVNFHPNPKERQCQRMLKLHTIALISYTSKVMLKILQARLQQYVNHELPDVQARFRKEIKLPTSIRSSKKQESSRKLSTSATPKPLTVWITTNCGKFFKRWEYQTTSPASWEICMQVRKQQLELDMENRLVPNRKRSTSGLYIVTLLI